MAQIVAKREFNYDGRVLVPGQVVERMYYTHEESLIKRGWLAQAPKTLKDLEHCDKCSRDFESKMAYDAHMMRHPEIDLLDRPLPRVDRKVPKLEEQYPDKRIVVGVGTGDI